MSSIGLFSITLLVIAIFYSLFLLKKIGPIDFWWWFTANICISITLVFCIDREYLLNLLTDIHKKPGSKLLCGVLSAGILFAIFSAGNRIARFIFPFADSGIREVYEVRVGNSPWKIIPLLALIIGPGEELLWRGFIQKQYSYKYGLIAGFVISVALYTLIHVGSRNVMLVLSAFVAGSFWGWLYRQRNSLSLNIISHILWDITVLIVFPFSRFS